MIALWRAFRCRIGWHRLDRLERIHKMSDLAWVVCANCGTPEPPPRTVVPVGLMDVWNRADYREGWLS